VRGHEVVDLTFLGLVVNGLGQHTAKKVLVGDGLVWGISRVTRYSVGDGVCRALDVCNLELLLVQKFQPPYLPVV